MTDLYLGLACMAALSMAMFRLSAWLAHCIPSAYRPWFGAAIVAAMFAYVHLVWQSTILADWLPFSNLIVVGNWFALFLAALAGVLVETPQLPPLRKGLGISALAGFGAYAMLGPLWGHPPVCGSLFSPSGDCVQSTDFTCTPASAASLLRWHDIPATEREMAELCLTRHGTNWLGLYRGLKLKTQGTRWDVEVVRCSADELSRWSDRPLIIEAGLDSQERVDPAFRHEFGWVPGAKHSVILCGLSPQGGATIIDPSPHIGREEWDAATLERLWRGYGMRLVDRRKSHFASFVGRPDDSRRRQSSFHCGDP